MVLQETIVVGAVGMTALAGMIAKQEMAIKANVRQIGDLGSSNGKLKGTLLQLNRAYEVQNERIAWWEENDKNKGREIGRIEEEQRELQETVDGQDRKLDEQQTTINNLKEDHDARGVKINCLNTKLAAQTQAHEKEMIVQSERFAKLEEKDEQRERQIGDLQEENRMQKADIAEVKNQNQTLIERNKSLEERNETLVKENADLKRENKDLGVKVDTLTDEVRNLTKQNEDQGKDIKQLIELMKEHLPMQESNPGKKD